jgi:hypothetical protein
MHGALICKNPKACILSSLYLTWSSRWYLNALRSINQQQGALASRQAARDFIAEVYVPRCVNKVQEVFFALVAVHQGSCLCLHANQASTEFFLSSFSAI